MVTRREVLGVLGIWVAGPGRARAATLQQKSDPAKVATVTLAISGMT
ncbi:MAG: hypothetical protein ACT4QD_09900 [Acidobacteriota bacterium]